MKIKKGMYMLCMVSMPLPPSTLGPKGGDFLLTCWRDEKEPLSWEFEYRFRYHVDDKVWDSEDPKHFYDGRFSGLESEVSEKLKMLVDGLASMANSTPEWCWIRGDSDKFKEIMDTNPPSFLHIDKNPSPERIKKYGLDQESPVA